MNLLLAFLLYAAPSAAQMTNVRDLFSKASEDVEANEQLLEITKGYTLEYNHIMYAYRGAAEMTYAGHVFWPGSKYSWFYDGQDKLQQAIVYDTKNVELRWIRYCIQRNCPTFLGYNEDLKKDKAFILENLDNTDWTQDYKDDVKSFITGD